MSFILIMLKFKTFRVKTTSVSGARNKIFRAGEIVSESDFFPGRASELVIQQFLEPLDPDIEQDPIDWASIVPNKTKVDASIIIPTYNENEKLLLASLQQYIIEGAQIIITTVEGDKNLDLIKEMGLDYVVTPLSEHPGRSPLGSFYQINKALPLIKRSWFCTASSNDIALPNKASIEIQKCMHSKKKVCYSNFYYMTEDGIINGKTNWYPYTYEAHLKGNFVNDSSIVNTKMAKKYLPFNLKFDNYAFWDFWLRVYKGEGNVFVYNPVPTWKYRQSNKSMHIQRMRDPVALAKYRADRAIMLAVHR